VDSVRQYRHMAEAIREQELQRALRALARGEDPRQIAAQLARGITNKLIHAPTAGLKRASAAGRQDLLLSARRLLGLESVVRGGTADPTSDPTTAASAAEDPTTTAPSADETPLRPAGRTLQ
jgi:glutamyl-tRNA reductase